MFGRDVIVISASAGGVDALPRLIASLPGDLPASVFIVLHIPSQGPGLLPQIIRRNASLSVATLRYPSQRFVIRRNASLSVATLRYPSHTTL
jgi:chemotaxis response regulator CheB